MIAIDFSRGSYYNLAGAGPSIWERLRAGATAEEVAAGFRVDANQRRAPDAFLERLVAEALVVADEATDGHASGAGTAETPEPVEFVEPRFEKYDDMQDYFVLDPIHDVDASGWPKPKPD